MQIAAQGAHGLYHMALPTHGVTTQHAVNSVAAPAAGDPYPILRHTDMAWTRLRPREIYFSSKKWTCCLPTPPYGNLVLLELRDKSNPRSVENWGCKAGDIIVMVSGSLESPSVRCMYLTTSMSIADDGTCRLGTGLKGEKKIVINKDLHSLSGLVTKAEMTGVFARLNIEMIPHLVPSQYWNETKRKANSFVCGDKILQPFRARDGPVSNNEFVWCVCEARMYDVITYFFPFWDAKAQTLKITYCGKAMPVAQTLVDTNRPGTELYCVDSSVDHLNNDHGYVVADVMRYADPQQQAHNTMERKCDDPVTTNLRFEYEE